METRNELLEAEKVEKPEALNFPSEISKEELHRQKHREYMRKYYQNHRQERIDYMREYGRWYRKKNREKLIAQALERYWRNRDRRLIKAREYYQKNRDRICAESRGRYRSDLEYREKKLSIRKMWRERRREAYREFKIKFGGKCSICGNDDLDVLQPHHPDRRREKVHSFIHSKEFTNWLKHGIKPNVVLLCANHHQKLHTAKARGGIGTL